MDEMWREISPFYKKLSVIERARYETRDSLAIKRFYVDLFKNKSVTNLKNTPDVDYFDVEKISKFFDASSEWISNHLRGHK